MSEQNKLTRRNFIKGAAAAGATAAAANLLNPFARTAFAESEVPTKWDEETDIIVVGTGVAGYGAAIEAKDAGADVIVIEKEKWYGGNSLLSGGNMQFPANHIQKAAGIEDKTEWAYEDVMIMGEHRNAPELVKQFVENSADTALWLEKLGIVWNPKPSLQAGCRVARTLVPDLSDTYPLARGLSEIFVLNKAAEERKIPVKLGYKLTRLYRADAKSPVVGIEVEVDGKKINMKANKAVILATGGFKANHQMIRALDPRLDEEFSWSGAPYTHTTGDGHFAAAAVGAGFVDMSFVCEFNFRVGSDRYVIWEPQTMDAKLGSGGLAFSTAGIPNMILVENDGNRYSDESKFVTGHVVWNAPHCEAYLNLPKRPRASWMIVDAAGAKDLAWKAEDFKNADPTKAPYLDPKLVATGATIAELAGKMGIPAANLEATLKKYNEYAVAGVDKDFERPAPMNAIKTGPFYAARIMFGTHDQSAGMRVNSKMQVLDQTLQAEAGSGPSVARDEERVIPHLYAAGEVNGGLFGADRGSGKMGSYLIQGRFAGKNAVKESAAPLASSNP